MNRNGILPKSTYEQEKVKRQLSSQKSLKSNGPAGKEADQHFAAMEENFINKMTEMGYEYTAIKDFIEDKGMPDDDPAILIAGMREPHKYRNKLFKPAQQQMQYDYFNPGMGGGGPQ